MLQRANLAFMFRHPAHLLAMGFGAGMARFAPGTFGTLLAVPLAFLFWTYASDAGFIAAIAILFVAGIWASGVTGKNLGLPDHPAIVWDEVVAFLLVLYFVGSDWIRIVMAFLLFRFFDIVKPPPIRQLDAALKNGFGVMADDVLAAGYALLILALWERLLK
jgi:phosphatidylglycerophosphatase A